MRDTRLPFHRHLRWLCLEGLSYNTVREYYTNLQMAVPTELLFNLMKADAEKIQASPMAKRRLKNGLQKEEDEVLWERLGYGEIYKQKTGKHDWAEIGRILNHPTMRLALDCCIIAKSTPEEISQLLPTGYALPISANTVILYQKYFFDLEGMVKADWISYLNLLREDRYSYNRVYAALTKAKDEVLHLVGLPTKMQFGQMLKNVMNTAHYRFEYFARQGSPEAQDEARKWAKVMIDAGVKHDKFGASDANDFSDLIQTEFEHVDEEILTINPEMISNIKPSLLEAKNTEPNAPAPPVTDMLSQRNPNDI